MDENTKEFLERINLIGANLMGFSPDASEEELKELLEQERSGDLTGSRTYAWFDRNNIDGPAAITAFNDLSMRLALRNAENPFILMSVPDLSTAFVMGFMIGHDYRKGEEFNEQMKKAMGDGSD